MRQRSCGCSSAWVRTCRAGQRQLAPGKCCSAGRGRGMCSPYALSSGAREMGPGRGGGDARCPFPAFARVRAGEPGPGQESRARGSPAPALVLALARAGQGRWTVENVEIARALREVADLLELRNENPFKVRAYRNAARTVEGLSRRVAELVEAGEDLEELPAVGKDMAAYITELVRTGRLRRLEQLEKRVPHGLAELT